MSVLKTLFQILASFRLAVAVFSLLFVLILLGTFYQVDHGLYQAQQKYFDSYLVLQPAGPLVVPLPGAYLLMMIGAVNLICGGVIRIRKSWRVVGVLIAHAGILLMLLGGWVSFNYAERGNMRLYPGETSDEFYSYLKWAVEITPPGSGSEIYTVDDDLFDDLGAGDSRVFHAPGLPFELTLSDYSRNATPVQFRPGERPPGKAVDGFYLRTLPPEKEGEMNVGGMYALVTDSKTGEVHEGILWGLSQAPMTILVDGEPWTIGMARKRWTTPFTITVNDFRHKVYAGTQMARAFESDVTKTENGVQDKYTIWMNHPLRSKGYTFFQASWGPQGAGPDDKLFTVFAVVRNPADQWPLYACIIISIGMTLHFGQSLLRYMRTEAKRRTA